MRVQELVKSLHALLHKGWKLKWKAHLGFRHNKLKKNKLTVSKNQLCHKNIKRGRKIVYRKCLSEGNDIWEKGNREKGVGGGSIWDLERGKVFLRRWKMIIFTEDGRDKGSNNKSIWLER